MTLFVGLAYAQKGNVNVMLESVILRLAIPGLVVQRVIHYLPPLLCKLKGNLYFTDVHEDNLYFVYISVIFFTITIHYRKGFRKKPVVFK